jgi:uncharacterized small protein (DUF1192 family)
MDTDDHEPRLQKTPNLGHEDISPLSLEELEERISELKGEILRCEAMIKSKKGSVQDAESFFKA